jgi:hypothetical protein
MVSVDHDCRSTGHISLQGVISMDWAWQHMIIADMHWRCCRAVEGLGDR